MQKAIDADLFHAVQLASALITQLETMGVLITIEPTRDPVKPGYKHLITTQVVRKRWEMVLAQSKKEEDGQK